MGTEHSLKPSYITNTFFPPHHFSIHLYRLRHPADGSSRFLQNRCTLNGVGLQKMANNLKKHCHYNRKIYILNQFYCRGSCSAETWRCVTTSVVPNILKERCRVHGDAVGLYGQGLLPSYSTVITNPSHRFNHNIENKMPIFWSVMLCQLVSATLCLKAP